MSEQERDHAAATVGTFATTRVDPHVKVCSEAIVDRAVDAGLDALVYAPHFTRLPDIEATANRLSRDDCAVLPGREVFTGTWRDRKHVLAIGLSDPIPDFITLDGAMEAFQQQDATVIVPHPEFYTVGLSEADIREHQDVIDAIEVVNPKHRPRHDRQAQQLAETLSIPAVGSSYAHLPWTVGDVWTEFDRPLDTPDDVNSLIETPGDGDRRVCRRTGIGAQTRAQLEFAHLGWENTWKKFDRLVLSGLEPTHPAHPAYDGQFDDCAVY